MEDETGRSNLDLGHTIRFWISYYGYDVIYGNAALRGRFTAVAELDAYSKGLS
jgi:hypothetical protein